MIKLVFACLLAGVVAFICISFYNVELINQQLRKYDLPRAHQSNHLERQCVPVTRIFFLKVHKAGSSTVASIIQRFGLDRNLNFVVPNRTLAEQSSNYIGTSGRLVSMSQIMALPEGHRYDILWNHVIYNRTAFRYIMPSDTLYIGIVRQPLQQFVSAFEYYGPGDNVTDDFYSMDSHQELFDDFLRNPLDYESDGDFITHTRNSMANDFGFTNAMVIDRKLRTDYLLELGKDFKLVMLLEYMDESLVLLKRYFCWDTKDILYFHQNKNIFKLNLVLTQEHHARHKIIAETDYDIYNYFYSLFWEKVWREGPEFFSEVAYFKQLLAIVNEHCLLNRTLYVSNNVWHQDITIDWADCQIMNVTEFDLYEVIYNRTVAFNALSSLEGT